MANRKRTKQIVTDTVGLGREGKVRIDIDDFDARPRHRCAGQIRHVARQAGAGALPHTP
jgi:hypothetical protein